MIKIIVKFITEIMLSRYDYSYKKNNGFISQKSKLFAIVTRYK